MTATRGTAAFREARDFLLDHRENYAEAVAGFAWPELDEFNWALDWFDVIAEGNDDPALWIVEEDGSEQRFSFAEMAHRSNQVASWLRARGRVVTSRGARHAVSPAGARSSSRTWPVVRSRRYDEHGDVTVDIPMNASSSPTSPWRATSPKTTEVASRPVWVS